MTSFCKFVRLRVGVSVNVTQFAVVKSRFCCKTKFVEVTIQESQTLPVEEVIFNCGDGGE